MVPLELGNMGWAQKPDRWGYQAEKKFCSQLDTILECDRQTDGQMNTGRQLVSFIHIASRGKNC